MELFDTHCHLNHEDLAGQVEAVMSRAVDAGVTHMAVVGYDWRSSLYAVHLAERYPQLAATVGIHPHDAETLDDVMFEKLAALAEAPSVKAIGEIGLDYYRDLSPRAAQRKAFVRQLDLARQLGKPITIHDRDAHGDLMTILHKEMKGIVGGIMHCYSGSWEMAQECLKLGFEISFAGPVTYTNAKSLPEIARQLPLEHILIETDSPYLTPHPYRGKSNEPAMVTLVAEKIAALKGIDVEVVAAATTANAKRIYQIN